MQAEPSRLPYGMREQTRGIRSNVIAAAKERIACGDYDRPKVIDTVVRRIIQSQCSR